MQSGNRASVPSPGMKILKRQPKQDERSNSMKHTQEETSVSSGEVDVDKEALYEQVRFVCFFINDTN